METNEFFNIASDLSDDFSNESDKKIKNSNNYCTKCGNRINPSDHYCIKCGNTLKFNSNSNPAGNEQVNTDGQLSPLPQNKPVNVQNQESSTEQRQRIGIIKNKKVLIISLCTSMGLLIGAVLIILLASINSSLDSKLIGHTWSGTGYVEDIEFYENGTYSIMLSTGNTKDGKWSVNGNVLKLSGRLGSGEYSWYENLSDSDISNGLVKSQYYSWYVSNDYFVICSDCVFGADRREVYKAD